LALRSTLFPYTTLFRSYSVEQTSSYSVTGATVGSLTLFSNSSASQTASPSGNEAHGDLADALESYVGPAPGRPAENTFTPKGMRSEEHTSELQSRFDLV